jgi:hypothetical protein
LRILSEEWPKSELLIEYLFEQILGEKKSWDLPKIYEVAASILGEQFGGDKTILFRLLENKRIDAYIEEKIIITLCEGWPDSDELQKLYEEIRKEQRELSIDGLYQLISRKSTNENLLDRILLDLKNGNFSYGPGNQTIVKCITRRLREDPDLINLFFKTISTTDDFNEKFVLVKLIVLAVGVNLEVRDWATYVLENKESKLELEVFSLDISTGDYISFFQGVLELLKN